MDDLIRRQAAIDAAIGWLKDRLTDRKNGESLADRLKHLPSAQQWIPCSERLPDKPNMYTVTDSKGDVVRFVFYDNESSRNYWRRCAKAWMPLPEPYKEEG